MSLRLVKPVLKICGLFVGVNMNNNYGKNRVQKKQALMVCFFTLWACYINNLFYYPNISFTWL
jgi:hypothetical protein